MITSWKEDKVKKNLDKYTKFQRFYWQPLRNKQVSHSQGDQNYKIPRNKFNKERTKI